MQERSVTYQNKKRKTASQLKERNKVYLLTKNLRTKKSSKKLNYVKVGSFLVKKTKKSVNYKLDLFKNVRIFPVFYILLLKSADSIIFLQNIFYFYLQKENQFEIEKILQQKDQKYLIK